MFTRSSVVLVSAVLCGLISGTSFVGAADSGTSSIVYDGGSKLPPGWTIDGWGGAEGKWVSEGGRRMLHIAPKNEEVSPWAGAWLHTSPPDSTEDALQVPAGNWRACYLNLRLADGVAGANFKPPVQVALALVRADGTTVRSSYEMLRLHHVGSEAKSGQVWHLFSMPLGKLRIAGQEQAASVTALNGVYFQFASMSPVLTGFRIGGIALSHEPLRPSVKSVAAADKPGEAREPRATPERFRKFEDLAPPFLLPPDPAIEIGKHGDYTFNGRPRFLIGAQMAEWTRQTFEPTSGYPDALNWIYEKPLDYTSAQRLGLDFIGLFMPPTWVKRVDPARAGVVEAGGEAFAADIMRNSRLPFYVDLTAAGWLHGTLVHSSKVSPEAKNTFCDNGPNNHWTPYSMLHPEGRALYRKMFEDAARLVVETGVRPLYYELLNEPGYDDPSLYNRAAFAESLKQRYGKIGSLNAVWGTSYASFDDIKNFNSRSDNPALFVEWTKFMEGAVLSLVREGVKTVKAVDAGAERFAVQPLGGDYYRVVSKSNINLFEISREMSTISLPTGGGHGRPGMGGLGAPPVHTIETPYVSPQFDGMVSRRFFLSLAEGKPLVDGEHYFHSFGASDGFWLHLARGTGAATIFHWNKRAWDWKPSRDAQGGRRLAELYPYNVLNPYAVEPDKLADIAVVKDEILSLDDVFVPRANRSSAGIGLLMSYPTVRYAQATGSLAHNFFRNYSVALTFSQYNHSVVFEEQLAERGRLDRHQVLVAAGVANTLDGTPGHVRQWVKKGGTLILGLETLQADEFGRADPDRDWPGLHLGSVIDGQESLLNESGLPRHPFIPGAIRARAWRDIKVEREWEVVARVGGIPAIVTRRLGKGRVWLINAKMPDYALASVLGGILRRHDGDAITGASANRVVRNASRAVPDCELVRLDNGELEVNIEVHRFVKTADEAGKRTADSEDSLSGYFLYNWDSYPKAFTFRSAEITQGAGVVDPLTKTAFEVRDGVATVWIPSESKRVLVLGKPDVLNHRFGRFPVMNAAGVQAALAEATRRAADVTAAKMAKLEEGRFPDFTIRGDKVLSLDLRPFVNRGFRDGVAGDGKGGWTDQGENSLHGEEWGRQIYRGVPFEVIRHDMNGGNGVIVLGSKNMKNVPSRVEGIPVGDTGERVRSLFFLHAIAWDAKQTAFSYVLNHADGSKTEIPITAGSDVGDWWLSGKNDLNPRTLIAWRNATNHGFWAHQWTNPKPENPVTTIDIVSAENGPVPIVIAITAELN